MKYKSFLLLNGILLISVFSSGCSALGKLQQPDTCQAKLEETAVQLSEAQAQIVEMREENIELESKLYHAERNLEESEAYICQLEDEINNLYKYGDEAVQPGQFRLISVLTELDMKQAISCYDAVGAEMDIRVYDLPSYAASTYTTIEPYVYLEVLAKVVSTSVWRDDYGDNSVWYLVHTPALNGVGNVVWIPENYLVEYTCENMYSITSPLHIQENATYYYDKNMKHPAEKDASHIGTIEFALIERLDNGTSLVSFNGGSPVWVYTADLVYPEPAE